MGLWRKLEIRRMVWYNERKMQKLRVAHMERREHNVDLYRIIATVFVVMLHVLGQGGILQNAAPNSAVYWVAWFMEILAYCAVNCFALISGYVMANKRTKVKNIVSLWFQIAFYSLLFSGLFFAFKPETRTIKNLVVACLPIVGNQWWYASSYFALFFFIPILNTAIAHISRKTLEKFLAVILIGVGILDCVIPIDAFLFADGYSAIWLIILYLFGAYIKKYNLKEKVAPAKSILVFGGMILLTLLSKLVIELATKRIFGEAKRENTFVSYTSVTIVLAAVFLFLFCLNLKISKSGQRIICFFAPATLGVYLIHVHPFVFRYIIKDAVILLAQKPVLIMVGGVLTGTLFIFFACSVMDRIRIWLFKLIRLGRLAEAIERKLDRISGKIFKDENHMSL